ncbi:MAG: [dimethylamine--corrinoid protein] Co-methyltransferase, partial [Thermodesulfobacteriota bacterium]
MGKIRTRLGDGTAIELTEKELRGDLENGTTDASERGGIPPLSDDEMRELYEICSSEARFSSVGRGREVVLSNDGMTAKVRRMGIEVDRVQGLQIHEKAFGADILEIDHIDYSYKAIKPIVGEETPILEQALQATIAPLFYGAMPNLGYYSRPDGPVSNPADLMTAGKIEAARQAGEEAVEHAVKDIVFVASQMYEAGADGIDIDTVGAAGDTDFAAALRATEILKKRYPQICIQMGMAGEFILGMHGEITYDGVRLAGLYPHEQVKLAEKAGVTIFGPVVNTATAKSIPENVARAVTFIKACVAATGMPVHANMGMGVGAVPLSDILPLDAVSMASRAKVDITRLDGL